VGKPLRVLLIEDSEDDALLLLRELSRNGYEPASQRIETGPQMEQALTQKWDLIISDYSLPHFDPLSALKILEHQDLDIPCIVVSGSVDETTILNAMKAGAADYLMKDNLMRLGPAVDRELREAASRRERRRLEEQMRHAQKMEAIGRLAGGVAHDFNNLLTVITGYSELLLGSPGLPEPVHSGLEEIKRAAARGGSLTRQLLIFSRKQKLTLKSVNLNDLVANMEKMLGRLIGENIGLSTVLRPDLGLVRADMGQFEQVVMNMVVNARDAMPDGGKLTIETANVTLPAAQAELKAGSHVMLAISDTGIGMSAETQSHIFEPFFTTKESGKGTGLGLATAYGIVKQSGGGIRVYSEPGRGTTFRVYLPRVDQPMEEVAAEPVKANSMNGTETVLVVEDDPEVRKLICEILRARGYHVLETRTGDEAIQMARTHADPVQLVLADVILPQMSGPDIVRGVKQHKPEIRALYISGYTDEAVLRHGMLDKGVTFLSKPFLPDVLAKKVREVLDGSA
jgi:two-component system, cell cycle sensor histidine kinase and response regulator CckA